MLGESPSKVMGWKNAGRIPSHKQREVLEKCISAGFEITTQHVVFPLGRSGESSTIESQRGDVACDRNGEAKRKAARS
ncbi:hypothetical protein ACFOWT_14890 [Croceibacterium xixiisoli]